MWENRMLQPWRMPLGPSFARKVPRSLQLPRLHTQPCFHANIDSLQAAINQQRISVQVLKMSHSHPNTGLLAARGDLGWKRGALLEHEGETAPLHGCRFLKLLCPRGPFCPLPSMFLTVPLSSHWLLTCFWTEGSPYGPLLPLLLVFHSLSPGTLAVHLIPSDICFLEDAN